MNKGLSMKKYLPRVYDQVLKDRLSSKGAILVEGPKWCGKTTTSVHASNSVVYLQDPKKREQYNQMIQLDPSKILKGDTPLLIDEWQESVELWDAIRFEVDKRRKFAQFILTGSSVPAHIEKARHSGTGRIARLRMQPMALFESGESSGEVSLKALFDSNDFIYAESNTDLEGIAFSLCRGGWPASVGASEKAALRQAYDYIDALTEIDISRVDGVRRNADTAKMLLRSYARMTASQASYKTILNDLKETDISLSDSTLAQYIESLQRLFVIEDLKAWNPNLRSKTAIRTSNTRHFVDPSIAAAALGANPSALLSDLKTFGLLFENLCIRDLRTYALGIDGEVRHFRDKYGLECDAVVCLRDGRYGLIEIKLGGKSLIDEGSKTLKKLSEKIDTEKMKQPSFLMVLTANDSISYIREDGVCVVPIGVLGP